MSAAVLQPVGVGPEQISGLSEIRDPVSSTCSPIERRGEAVVFKPEFMAEGRPYFFTFLDVHSVAIKRHDGTIDFYRLM